MFWDCSEEKLRNPLGCGERNNNKKGKLFFLLYTKFANAKSPPSKKIACVMNEGGGAFQTMELAINSIKKEIF